MRLLALPARRLDPPHFGITHVRWTLHSHAGWRLEHTGSWIGLQLVRESKCDGEWQSSWLRLCVYLATRWMWGENHCYYDGPNCARWYGFLHVESSPPECPKCEEGM